MSNELMIILRLIHIVAGILWVGSGIFVTMFVSPTVRDLKADGGKFMAHMMAITPFVAFFPVVAILTVISGGIMYYNLSNHFSGDFFSSASGIVWTIGSVAGILAFLHGGMVIGPTTGKLNELGQTISSAGGPPTPEQAREFETLQEKVTREGYISLVLMVIAVFGMATARYW